MRPPPLATIAPAPPAVPLAAKVAWLSDPAAYRERSRQVGCIETHFAYLFLTDTRAYKLKKPFMAHGADLRTLAERERCCREELRLNGRLAHETYLDVVPLVTREGRLALAESGVVIDWLVMMRRLDHRQMLDTRLRAGTVVPADLEAVVARLHHLDRRVPGADTAVTPTEHLAGLARRLEELLREVARPEFDLPVQAHAPLALALRACHAELRSVFAERAWRVREGHGDLRAEHVWLGPPLQIIDALEFDRELRMLDPAEDLAMLAVDTERLGGDWTRATLCAAYLALAGDRLPEALWRFYLSLRAAVRAKLAIWHLDDAAHAADPERWRTLAAEYLAQSTRLLTGP